MVVGWGVVVWCGWGGRVGAGGVDGDGVGWVVVRCGVVERWWVV